MRCWLPKTRFHTQPAADDDDDDDGRRCVSLSRSLALIALAARIAGTAGATGCRPESQEWRCGPQVAALGEPREGGGDQCSGGRHMDCKVRITKLEIVASGNGLVWTGESNKGRLMEMI